jgi:hypothetical protein
MAGCFFDSASLTGGWIRTNQPGAGVRNPKKFPGPQSEDRPVPTEQTLALAETRPAYTRPDLETTGRNRHTPARSHRLTCCVLAGRSLHRIPTEVSAPTQRRSTRCVMIMGLVTRGSIWFELRVGNTGMANSSSSPRPSRSEAHPDRERDRRFRTSAANVAALTEWRSQMSCKNCRNTGICPSCHGKGTLGGGWTNPQKCGDCNGNKKCSICRGKG